MHYFIGINAGGSKTDCVLTDGELNLLFSLTARGCNLKKEGIDYAFSLLKEIFNDILTKVEIKAEQVAGFCAGFAGGGRERDAGEVKNLLKNFIEEKYGASFPVMITTDALITLEGAFCGNEGAVLIAGTGSIIYAKDNKEIFHRAGGFGRVIGDEGSGYSIGRKGLAAAAKHYDSRSKENLLVQYLKENFNINSSEELIKKVYEENFEIQAFAPFVIKAAEEKDKTALKIIEEETEELLLHIKAVKNYFGKSFKLCLSGGIITTDNFLSRMLKEKIASRFRGIEIIEPAHSPELGAAILIKKKSGL